MRIQSINVKVIIKETYKTEFWTGAKGCGSSVTQNMETLM